MNAYAATMHFLSVIGALLAIGLLCREARATEQSRTGPSAVQVQDYLPRDFVKDASESYLPQLQSALDAVKDTGGAVIFPAGAFLIDDPAGLRVHSGTRLVMHNTHFTLAEDMKEDGQAFLGEGVHGVRFQDGVVRGRRDQWDPGVNIAGIRLLGPCRDIRIEGMRFEALSSNAVGIFGESDDDPVMDIWIRDVIARNCCNYYGDYRSERPGPAEGSDRKDQGNIALYHVRKWVVDGCDFDGSQSDGTHFYHAHEGRFVNNRVVASQMGGYFLEGCEYVLASNNLIAENGSRGVTIERDSVFCTLNGNVVERSGREGLWAPDVMGIVVADNIFRENGRKDDADRDCEIRIDNSDDYETQTRDIRVSDNLFYASPHQTAAVMITDDVRDCVVRGNSFRGAVEGDWVSVAETSRPRCVVEANDSPPE